MINKYSKKTVASLEVISSKNDVSLNYLIRELENSFTRGTEEIITSKYELPIILYYNMKSEYQKYTN